MIRLTVRLALWIVPICVVLCAVALVISEQTRHESVTLKSQTCTLPCWGGILPGETPFEDVIPLLIQNFPNSVDSPPVLAGSLVSFGVIVDNQPVSGVVFYDRGRAGTIQLHLSLPLSDLLETLGAPGCVRYRTDENSTAPVLLTFWQIDDLSITTLLNTDGYRRLEPGMTAQDLNINADGEICGADAIPWMGFAPLWRYKTTMRAQSNQNP
jgi:hypothetical protein